MFSDFLLKKVEKIKFLVFFVKKSIFDLLFQYLKPSYKLSKT
jgi:hypothetical protein